MFQYKLPESVNRIGKGLPPSIGFRAPPADAQTSSTDADRPAPTSWKDSVNRLDVTTKMIYMFKQFIPAPWMTAFCHAARHALAHSSDSHQNGHSSHCDETIETAAPRESCPSPMQSGHCFASMRRGNKSSRWQGSEGESISGNPGDTPARDYRLGRLALPASLFLQSHHYAYSPDRVLEASSLVQFLLGPHGCQKSPEHVTHDADDWVPWEGPRCPR